MQDEVIMAGFGGQGIMLIGKMLAYAGLAEGNEVCWLPSYGPEMRGGTANCTVVVADRPIGSPIVQNPRCAVVMNRPSLERFGPEVKPGGIVIINSTLIDIVPDRDDITIHQVPANDIAAELELPKSANIVILGAYIEASGIVELKSIKALIEKQFGKKPKIAEINIKALDKGAESVRD